MFKGIDLFSDTVTKPTQAMKEAMMNAELGDEQKGEDPTTLQLEEMVAKLLGKEAAMFFPTATMSNQIALHLLSEPGDELLAADNCHLFFAEAGGPAIHSSLMTRPIVTASGIFSGDDVRAAYRWSKGPHYPISKIVSIENTTNMGGGIAWHLETINSVLSAAADLGLKTHLDGSRLFNAVVKTKTPAHQIASRFDTVTLCLSKGLGCPLGAVLAFSKKDFAKVRRFKQLFGGALRQSGMIAAAGIYSLQNNIDRLAEDHANAELLAQRLKHEVPQVEVESYPDATNMVFFHWKGSTITSAEFDTRCIQHGVRFSRVGEHRFRAVTHLDIKRDDIDRVIDVVKKYY